MSGVIWTERGDVPGRGKEGMLGSGRWGKLGMLRQGRGELLVSMGLSSSWSEPEEEERLTDQSESRRKGGKTEKGDEDGGGAAHEGPGHLVGDERE